MLFIFIILILVFYIAWSIGANDETFATPIGCRIISINKAVVLGGILAFFGAITFSSGVNATIGENLWTYTVTDIEVLAVLIGMAIWLTIASYYNYPVSTTHAVVGAVVGIAWVVVGFNGINYNTLLFIISGWLLSPILGVIFGYAFFILMHKVFLSRLKGFEQIERSENIFGYLVLIAVSITEFSRGANDVANAVAVLSLVFQAQFSELLILGGFGMAIGLITLGRRVIRTVGLKIIEMHPSTAFAISLSTTIVLFFGTMFGYPLSGTHILVSAVLGVGLATGAPINKKELKGIVYSWILTFPISAIFAIGVYFLLLAILPIFL